MFFIRSALAGALTTAALLSGCTSTGIFGADIVRNGRAIEPVMFSWKSTNGGIDGTLAATLPDATYQGRFMQITRQVDTDSMAPMWSGWPAGWADWPLADAPLPMDEMQFSTVYSGRVVANLKSDGGALMRCRFRMARPDAGMAGGGTGECQLAGGTTIQAAF